MIFLFRAGRAAIGPWAQRAMHPPRKRSGLFRWSLSRGGLPLIVGILFVVGLISKYLFSCRVALALTLQLDSRSKGTALWRHASRITRGVHVAMALGMAGVILAVPVLLGGDSVINHGLQGRQLAPTVRFWA